MKLKIVIAAFVAAAVMAPVAPAHVTLNPGEWEAGGFARFAVRVPSERPNASTVEVTMQFPENVISASFQDVPGWQRAVEMVPLEEPIEEEGEEPVTQRLGSVTWTGGEVEPGEFVEFGVSFQVPEDATGALLFPAIQTYSNGEAVRWISPDAEAETPAPRVEVLPAAADEGRTTTGATTTTEQEPAAAGGGSGDNRGDDDGTATLALVLGIAGLVAGLAALGVALTRRPAGAR
jgi:periplasmic copper chaperone A